VLFRAAAALVTATPFMPPVRQAFDARYL